MIQMYHKFFNRLNPSNLVNDSFNKYPLDATYLTVMAYMDDNIFYIAAFSPFYEKLLAACIIF